MKIILNDNGLRALINFRIDVIEHFVAQGHQVVLIYPACTKEEELINKIPQKCKVYEVNMVPSGSNPLKDVSYLCQLYKIYKEEKPDIVFNYTIKPNIYGSLAAKVLKIKRVDMVAGLGYIFTGNGLSKKIGRLLYKIGLRVANRVITLNMDNYNLLIKRGFVLRKNMILYGGGEGVNLSHYPYAKNEFNVTRFLMVARVLYDKGYQEYVDAAEIVKKQYPNVDIELLGPLDETSPMGVPKKVVEQDVKANKIKYLGVTNDVPSYLKRDGVVVVVSSYHEGLNRSLMEACAMARPVITTNIAGCKETVEQGINGYIVIPKDKQSLAEAMIRFIELPQKEKQEMAENSYRKAVQCFDVKIVLKQYDKIISELIP